MSATVFKLKDIVFNNNKLPNLKPFVAWDSLRAAWDFSDRSDRLLDVTGNFATPLEPFKNRHDLGIVNTPVAESEIISNIANGAGIKVVDGYLRAPFPRGGSINQKTDSITFMAVAASSKDLLTPNEGETTKPTIANFIDYFSRAGNTGINLDVYADGAARARVSYGGGSLATTDTNYWQSSIPVILFLTLKDGYWTLYDATSNQTIKNHYTSMNYTEEVITFSPSYYTTFGGTAHPESLISSAYTELYQIAFWERALTDEEIQTQVRQTRQRL